MSEQYHPLMPITREGSIAIVTFNRPEMRNCFNLSMWRGLQTTMEALSADDALRCVVLRGAGTKAFSAGADISAFAAERGTREQEDIYGEVLHTSLQSVRLCQHPGGDQLRFGITARNLGIWYPYAEIDPIIQMVGTAVTAEIFIEGRIFNGAEAFQKGLLSRLVAEADVETEAMALAQRITEGSPLSARFHKEALRKLRGDLPLTREDHLYVNGFVETEDFKNASKAFLEKRKPVWQGR